MLTAILSIVVGRSSVCFGLAWLSGLRVANEYERAVVFRLGRLIGTKGPGLYWLIPFGFDKQKKVDLRTKTIDMESQESITKDSVTVKVNAVVWLKIVDPIKAVVSVADYYTASYQVALTSLRNIIGQHVLDEVLKERDKINNSLQEVVDTATEPWGVKVEMVEMKDVEIPLQMQRAMAQEAQATREKRARIIKAEAEQEAAAKLEEAAVIITEEPARARAAPHADDHRGRRRAEHDHDRHDAERVRQHGRKPGEQVQGHPVAV